MAEKPVALTFHFDEIRSIKKVEINVPVPSRKLGNSFVSKIAVNCLKEDGDNSEVFGLESMRMSSDKIALSLVDCAANSLSLRITYHGKFLAIGEVTFQSGEFKYIVAFPL